MLGCHGQQGRIGAGFPDMSLTEALADPLIRAVMAADRVDPARLAIELAETARRFGCRLDNSGGGVIPLRSGSV